MNAIPPLPPHLTPWPAHPNPFLASWIWKIENSIHKEAWTKKIPLKSGIHPFLSFPELLNYTWFCEIGRSMPRVNGVSCKLIWLYWVLIVQMDTPNCWHVFCGFLYKNASLTPKTGSTLPSVFVIQNKRCCFTSKTCLIHLPISKKESFFVLQDIMRSTKNLLENNVHSSYITHYQLCHSNNNTNNNKSIDNGSNW